MKYSVQRYAAKLRPPQFMQLHKSFHTATNQYADHAKGVCR